MQMMFAFGKRKKEKEKNSPRQARASVFPPSRSQIGKALLAIS